MKLGSKSKRQKLYLIRGAVVLIAVLCILVGLTVVSHYQTATEMADRRDGLAEEKASLEARKASLEQEVDYLEDERSVEAEIRRNFDVAKDGEQVVIILDKPTAPAAPLATSTGATEDSPWYMFWR